MADGVAQIIIKDLFNLQSLSQLDWQPFREGVQIVSLYDHGPDSGSAALLKYDAGARVPLHKHTGAEHIIVLSGAQGEASEMDNAEGNNDEQPAGTLIVNFPGSTHRVSSRDGCIVLVIWERRVRFSE